MNPRLKEMYYSKVQMNLAKKLSLKNKLMNHNAFFLLFKNADNA